LSLPPASSLQDQHPLPAISGQAVGDDAAGGARTYDNIVEITFKPLRHRPISTHPSGRLARFHAGVPLLIFH
jgi:hypothetical protein